MAQTPQANQATQLGHVLIVEDEGPHGREGTLSFSLPLRPPVSGSPNPPDPLPDDLSEFMVEPARRTGHPKTLDAFHRSVCAAVRRTEREMDEPDDDWRSLLTVESGTRRRVMSLHQLVEGLAAGDRAIYFSRYMPTMLCALNADRAALILSVWVGEDEAVLVLSASPDGTRCSMASIRRDWEHREHPPTLDRFARADASSASGPCLDGFRVAFT